MGDSQEVFSGGRSGGGAAKSGGRPASPIRFSSLESEDEVSEEDFDAEYDDEPDDESDTTMSSQPICRGGRRQQAASFGRRNSSQREPQARATGIWPTSRRRKLGSAHAQIDETA